MTQILPQATVHQLNCSCLGAVDGGCDAGQHSHIVVPIQIADAIIFLSYITLHYRQPKLFKSRISVERKFCFIIWTHFKWQHGKNITLPVKRILHCFLENIHQNPPSLSVEQQSQWLHIKYNLGRLQPHCWYWDLSLLRRCRHAIFSHPHPGIFFSKIRVS